MSRIGKVLRGLSH